MPDHRWKEALESPVFVRENLLAVPLREQSAIGLLLVQGEAENLRQRLPFLRFLAAQVTLAVRNAQAYLRAEELALTEERNRIAREIHDGIAQALAFMALKLDLSERLLQTDPERALEELHQVKETLRAQIREVRRSIFALRPIDLERYGFLESVRRYATAFAEQAGFRVRLSLPEKIELSQASELVFSGCCRKPSPTRPSTPGPVWCRSSSPRWANGAACWRSATTGGGSKLAPQRTAWVGLA